MSTNLKDALGTDSYKKAVVVGIAGGYLLGRTKKLRLALTLGAVLAGRRLGLDPQELISNGLRKVTELPQFEQLSDQVRDELMAAARMAVSSVVNRRVGSFNDLLKERTGRLTGEAEEPEEELEEDEEEPEEDEEEPKEEEEEKPRRSSVPRGEAKRKQRHERARADGRTGKKAPAKKTPAQKASAKKAPAKKAAAKKTSAARSGHRR